MKKIFVFLVTALFCFPSLSHAQVEIIKPLTVKGGIGGGLSLGQSDFSDFNGYNLGGKLKLDIKALPFKLVGHAHYNSFSADIDVFGQEVSVDTEIISVGGGIEYSLLPLPMISPYLSGDLAMNFYSGDNTDSESRFGAGLGVGAQVDLPLMPISFDVEAKYRLNNAFNKEDNEGDSNHFQIWAQVMFDIF